jgi:hypothetical protein
MALAEVVDGYGLRALAGAACVGHVYFCSHSAGVTIGIFQLISAALTIHAGEISKSTPTWPQMDGRREGGRYLRRSILVYYSFPHAGERCTETTTALEK